MYLRRRTEHRVCNVQRDRIVPCVGFDCAFNFSIELFALMVTVKRISVQREAIDRNISDVAGVTLTR